MKDTNTPKEIKRYDIDGGWEGYSYLRNDRDGDWVMFDDIEPTLQALREEIEHLLECVSVAGKRETMLERKNQSLQAKVNRLEEAIKDWIQENREALDAYEEEFLTQTPKEDETDH